MPPTPPTPFFDPRQNFIDPCNPCGLRKCLTHVPTPPTSPHNPRNLADSHELVFGDTDYFQCNIKLFVSTQKCTFVLDIVQNIVSRCYIFVVTQYQKCNHVSKKNKISLLLSQKKFRFLCITNFLYSIFTFHISNMLIFFAVILERKRNFKSIFYSPSHIPKQLLKAGMEKRCSYYHGTVSKSVLQFHVITQI